VIKGTTSQGNEFKNRSFVQSPVESVPGGGNIDGITHQAVVNTKKSSSTAGFSASRKCGSVKGNSY